MWETMDQVAAACEASGRSLEDVCATEHAQYALPVEQAVAEHACVQGGGVCMTPCLVVFA